MRYGYRFTRIVDHCYSNLVGAHGFNNGGINRSCVVGIAGSEWRSDGSECQDMNYADIARTLLHQQSMLQQLWIYTMAYLAFD